MSNRTTAWLASNGLPWGVFAVAAIGVSALWHGTGARSTLDKATDKAAVDDQAEQAEVPAPSSTIVVDFRDDISAAALAAKGFVEIPVGDYSAHDRLYRIELASPREAQAALAKLSRDPDVETADFDAQETLPPDEADTAGALAGGSMEAECGAGQTGKHDGKNDTKNDSKNDSKSDGHRGGEPNDPCFKYQWHLRQIGLPDAWKLGTGKDIVVAVIDTGVTKVGDLANTRFVPGYNFLANNADASDDHGHGTHVAGTIAQSTNNKVGVAGVAPDVAIMPLKVLSARGSGSVAGISQAIRWAADHGANVINMSLGGPSPIGAMGSAIKYAHDKGVVVVAAAGNDGKGRVSYPARYPGVLAVASTQFDESTTFYSNWGPEIDLAAPGGNVRVDQNGDGQPDGVLQHTIVPGDIKRTDYLWFMGTSMASPHVAGVAALVMGAGVRKPEAVEELLMATARKPKGHESAGARVDDHYGAGVVDAAAALRKARGGRGAGELVLAGAFALLGLAGLRRRGGFESLGAGFVVALVAGASGLFALPFFVSTSHFGIQALSGSVAQDLSGVLGARNPLVWSAALPVALVALFYGLRRLRPALAGFAFGVAGTLLFAALAGTVDVRFVPELLDRTWLAANACVAAVLATAVIRKG